MRKFNINREPISSEEISTFKDFKSIMRKHAQTTEDLAKIKPSNKGMQWALSIGGTALVAGLVTYFALANPAPEVAQDTVVEKVEQVETTVSKPEINWKTAIRSNKENFEALISAESITTNRIEYANISSTEEAISLLGGGQNSDAEFALSTTVFKLDEEVVLNINNTNDVYQLNEKGEWQLLNAVPVEMPSFVKPQLLKTGEPAILMHFKGFSEEYEKYENVFWQPVDFDDLDDSYFTTSWEDAKVEQTKVKGIYRLTFIDGDVVKRFNGYPVLQKTDYKQALSNYNKKLAQAQEELKAAPKEFKLGPGIYTVK